MASGGWLNSLKERWVTRKNADKASGVSVVVASRLFPSAVGGTGQCAISDVNLSPITGTPTAKATASASLSPLGLSSPEASGLASAAATGSISSLSLGTPEGVGQEPVTNSATASGSITPLLLVAPTGAAIDYVEPPLVTWHYSLGGGGGGGYAARRDLAAELNLNDEDEEIMIVSIVAWLVNRGLHGIS